MAKKAYLFMTGKISKLAKTFEIVLREKGDVEIEMLDGRVITGKVSSFEMTPSYFALGVSNSDGLYVINFAQASTIRMPSKVATALKVKEDPDRRRMFSR